ncbi:MAG: hypothetical protein OXU62_04385 [Gammaproteobacteria bacterium]|nr:hypothetical protein [Gammaproteobacteria bacterium]
MSKYERADFYAKLIEILKDAHTQGKPSKCIKAGELHDSVVAPEDSYKKTGNHCVPKVCGVMWDLESRQNGKATVIYEPKNHLKQGARLEIEFDTADLPE